ncbi:MAG: aconitase family protein [Oribacterium sp.]|nr:aconitase family protein [Oribacterium sp.]
MMVKLTSHGVFLDEHGEIFGSQSGAAKDLLPAFASEANAGRAKTMAGRILSAHDVRGEKGENLRKLSAGDLRDLRLRFDAMVSPDNNYVSILQTARASGMEKFPMPYVLSNCHNTLCGTGGTILEDDHRFGLSNAEKYGGIFVPPYRAVLHQYMREMMAGGGNMILGSDSHTRYGALGTMGFGEGGGELVKQLVGRTYDIAYPAVIAVVLKGSLRPGVGPMDVALALVAETFPIGFTKNKMLEIFGPGVKNLTMEERIGIDVMTTESAALSSIWCTDEKTEEYLLEHGRADEYRRMTPEDGAYYDAMIEINLDTVEPMIALPFHPSHAVPIRVFKENMEKMLREVEEEGNRIKGSHGAPFRIMQHIHDGGFYPDQALVSGCAGGLFENIVAIRDILRAPLAGVQKEEQAGPYYADESRNSSSIQQKKSLKADSQDGTTMLESTAGHNANIKGHVETENALQEEQSLKESRGIYTAPAEALNLHVNAASLPIMQDLMNQGVAVDLADAGVTLRPCICGPCFGVTDTPADNELSIRHVTRNYPNREGSKPKENQMAAVCLMDARSIAATVRNGGRLTAATELTDVVYTKLHHHFNSHIYEKQVSDFRDRRKPELPLVKGPNIADWPEMAPLKKHLLLKVVGSYQGSVTTDELIPSGEASSYRSNPEKISSFTLVNRDPKYVEKAKAVRALEASNFSKETDITFGSIVVSEQIGDGSSREQAASCQKVLGGFADLANEYSTKRYRSNLINWGLLPLRTEEKLSLKEGTYLFIENIDEILSGGQSDVSIGVLENFDIGAEGSAQTEAAATLEKLTGDSIRPHIATTIHATLDQLTHEERDILQSGCLINFNRHKS